MRRPDHDQVPTERSCLSLFSVTLVACGDPGAFQEDDQIDFDDPIVDEFVDDEIVDDENLDEKMSKS